jgi:hypothetical protein
MNTLNRIKVIVIAFILLIAFLRNSPVYSESDVSSVSPAIRTFALNYDNIGAIDNSVNLFTGDVNLPINLISLADVNVSITYSSNIQNIVDRWCFDAPTGILGLGWSMDYDKIIVDHKGTGTREDDECYLISGGSSNLLVRIGNETDNPKQYSTKSYLFWKIYYYTTDEKWEIIKEDGKKYIFGDKNSGRNTVQWGVKWGNWIGNSANISGQQQFVLVSPVQ